MDLLAKLQEDMKSALKAGEKDRLQVIRMLISDVKNIDLMPNKPTAQQAVESYGKKLKKSLEEYQKLNKPDEVEKLRFEIGVVEQYLPKKLSEEETAARVDEFLAKNSYTQQQFGQAMGALKKELGDNVDAGILSKVLKQKLTK